MFYFYFLIYISSSNVYVTTIFIPLRYIARALKSKYRQATVIITKVIRKRIIKQTPNYNDNDEGNQNKRNKKNLVTTDGKGVGG